MNADLLTCVINHHAFAGACSEEHTAYGADAGAKHQSHGDPELAIVDGIRILDRSDSSARARSDARANQSPLSFLRFALDHRDLANVRARDARWFAIAIDGQCSVSGFDHPAFDLFPILLLNDELFVGLEPLHHGPII
jgi:hypothetical protein